jgi:predicted O-linked N-acetylglucosamine transferase (SPINDLY family)
MSRPKKIPPVRRLLINPVLDQQAQQIAHLFQQGVALHQQGLLSNAKLIYDSILNVNPKHFDALHLTGVIYHQSGQFQVAVDLMARAIEINPNNPFVYSNRGNSLNELKEFEAAIASYDKAISLKPDFVGAYYNRGSAFQASKQLDAAVASFDKAIELKPDYADAFYNRGNALKELTQLDAAVASYDRAIALQPDYADAYSNRGIALQGLMKLDAAVASHDTAIALKPDLTEAYYNRGNALQELRQLNAAVASYDNAIGLKPDLAEAYSNRGHALQALNQFVAAVVSYDKAIGLEPDCRYLLGMKQHTKMLMCDWQDFDSGVLELSRKIRSALKVSPSFPILSLPISLAEQHQAAFIWSTDMHPYNPSLGPIAKSSRRNKIRIGYFSADFHNHATTYLMAELFERHDKSKFELIAFSFGPDTNDHMRSRVSQAFYQFLDVSTMSDKAVARLSRELGIDIAVDLKGATQHARLGIFSYMAAPIQVSYLGYPGTLGVDYMDYLIADKTLVPQRSQSHYSEKIVYLPHSYQVNDAQRIIAQTLFTKQELGLPQAAFVFCCFNNGYKITPPVFDAWIRILKAVDASVLWLLNDDQTAITNLRNEAQLRGLDPARLVFAKRMDLPEHLARHKAADLFLDTQPYNAHTTGSDALWAGLPVLTCTGESFASRVAASLLYAIGLPELVTETQADYEALAIELATNPVKLKAIKDKLESNRLTTPLFDTPRFAKHIEAAYTTMYERYQADLLPDHIDIQP